MKSSSNLMPLFMKWVTNHRFNENPQLPMPVKARQLGISLFLLFVLVQLISHTILNVVVDDVYYL